MKRHLVWMACAALVGVILSGCPLTPPSTGVSRTELYFRDGVEELTFEVWSRTQAPIEFSVIPKETWIHCTPTSGESVGPDDRVTVTVTIDQSKAAFYEGTIRVVSNGGNVDIKVITDPDYFTEYFNQNDNDLRNLSILWSVADVPDYYRATVAHDVAAFPSDTNDGTDLTEYFLEGSDPVGVPLLDGKTVSFYGETYNTVYVGSDGYLAFGDGADVARADQTLPYHFGTAGISAFFANFDIEAGGAVTWRQFHDRVAFTFAGVPEAGKPDTSNSFQVELFFNGDIRVTYLEMDAERGIAGLSAGVEPDPFVESDLISYPTVAP